MICTGPPSQDPSFGVSIIPKGQEILLDIHAGTCGGHIGARALPAKVL
jgi:hypothetical protein